MIIIKGGKLEFIIINPRQLAGISLLVGHLRLQFLGLVDHLLDLRDGGHSAADVELGVDLLQLRLQVLGHTMAELLDGVDASLLQQFCELGAYAVDTEQVGMIGPAQDQFVADAGSLGQFLAALGGCSLLEQFALLVDTCGGQFLCIHVAYTLDVNNLVIHNLKVFELMNDSVCWFIRQSY